MKKIFTLLLLAATTALLSCTKEQPYQIDPNTKLEISGIQSKAEGLTRASQYLTDSAIVRRATAMITGTGLTMGMWEGNRDTVNHKFLVTSIFVLNEGQLLDDIITQRNVIWFIENPITHTIADTIAYIPNAVMEKAEVDIRTAYAEGDLQKCVELMRTAWTFHPTTGEEYRQMIKDGTN